MGMQSVRPHPPPSVTDVTRSTILSANGKQTNMVSSVSVATVIEIS